MTSYFVIEVWGDVEPKLHGPYRSDHDQVDQAVELRRDDPEMNNGLYWLDVDFLSNEVHIGAFPAALFTERLGEDYG